jgi:hypothetical protein
VPSYEGGDGILSNDPSINPQFANFSMVYIIYCDGASYSGNVAAPVKVGSQTIYFRGHSIYQGILTDLYENQGMRGASELVLAGCSAGGLAAYVHCDEWSAWAQKYAAPGAKTRCIPDAGYFIDAPNVNNVGVIRPEYQYVFNMQNCSSGVDQSCIAAVSPSNAWQCFFPQYSIQHTTTPVFAVNSGYDVRVARREAAHGFGLGWQGPGAGGVCAVVADGEHLVHERGVQRHRAAGVVRVRREPGRLQCHAARRRAAVPRADAHRAGAAAQPVQPQRSLHLVLPRALPGGIHVVRRRDQQRAHHR